MHLAIASLRSLGLACAMSAAYLRTTSSRRQASPRRGRRLRLVFVFCPELGWVDFDPTSNVMPEADHLTLGYGRDFGDVGPIGGILTGGGKHDVKVGVTVSVL